MNKAHTAKAHMIELHSTLSILVYNEPGVTARIAGLFLARNYNLESITGSWLDAGEKISRITVVTRENAQKVKKIIEQIRKLVPVYEVVNLTNSSRELGHQSAVEREVALVKLEVSPEKRVDILTVVTAFKAEIIDMSNTSFIMQLVDTSRKINQFIEITKSLGSVEVARSGVVALLPAVNGDFTS